MKRYFYVGFAIHLLFWIGAIAETRWTIEIDASAKGAPSRVKNFIAVQGSPMGASDEQGSNETSRQFELAAWKALNPTMDVVYLIDEGSQGLQVIRSSDEGFSPGDHLIGPVGPKRDLYLDTRFFDAMQQHNKEVIGGEGFRRIFVASYMPKTLSSNPSAKDFFTYPPADYDEWKAVLEAAVRYLNKIGIDNPAINIFGEPESDTIWNVLAPDGTAYPISTEPVIREYVRMFAESQRAIKAADPGAKALAMSAGVWSADLFRELRAAPKQKGLDDFIAYVAEYNRSLPPEAKPAELDNIAWQGYSWKDEKRLQPMVEHIQSVLARHGFDPNVPQYLLGWSGGWASPQGIRYPLIRYAAHLAYNIIDQINPGGKPGPIFQAQYYTWNLEDETNKSSLVRTVHRPIAYDGVTVSEASDKDCVRPAYTAFVALKTMEDGHLLGIKETRPELARSMATMDRDGIHVLFVNYTDRRQEAEVILKNLPKGAKLDKAVLRRVPKDEVCGTGNWFPVNDPLSLLLTEPARFISRTNQSAEISMPLPVNGVALLQIPR